jgi:xanthine/uracil permease
MKSYPFTRRIQHVSHSGIISLGLEHFFAMFPATIMVPILVNSSLNATVIDVSLVLFTSGLGTILFNLLSGGKIPSMWVQVLLSLVFLFF